VSADFTSARFLGFGMPASAGVPNLGKPAVLIEPPGAAEVAHRVALAQGAGAGLLARSALHGLIDILAVTATDAVVLLDEHSYPISTWAAHATKKGAEVITYRHHDADHVRRLVKAFRRRAVVLADAWCAGCLRAVPLAQLAEITASAGARLVLDDSLAFGVLGRDGCGTPGWAGVSHDSLLWVASGAKAYGAAVAVVTGPRRDVARNASLGPNRMHSSPAPASEIATLGAAIGDRHLPARRRRLAANTRSLRDGLACLGLRTLGGPLPVIAIDVVDGVAAALHSGLRRRGVQSLLVRSACSGRSLLTFCVRADHTDEDITDALEAVSHVLRRAA
jgi:8-amino-7-oxononanoate synthase